jgi:hypothetical protein
MRAEKAIAVPWLELDIIGEPNAPKEVKVIGHEGRARADAFKAINGDIYMPVQLHPAGLRARNLSPEFFAFISKHGLVAERSKQVVKLHAKMFYWDNTEVPA